MPLRLRHRLLSVAIGLTASGVSAAQTLPARPPSPDSAAAQALFERGRQLMAEQRAEEACPLFEESQRLEAGIGTQYNLASCYEAAGRFASAYTLFLDVVAAARARGQTERAEVAKSRAESVEPQVSRIVIEVAAEQRSSLTVERDGSIVGPPQWGLAIPVDPGRHEIRAYGPGFMPWARAVEVGTSAGLHTVQITVLPASANAGVPCDPERGNCQPSETKHSRPFLEPLPHKIGLAALGVGIVGLGVSAGFAVHARSKNESSETAGCDDRGCPNQPSLDLRRAAVSAGNWATVAAGIGLAGVAAAGVLFWVVPEPDAPPEPIARFTPRVGPDLAGIDVCGSF